MKPDKLPGALETLVERYQHYAEEFAREAGTSSGTHAVPSLEDGPFATSVEPPAPREYNEESCIPEAQPKSAPRAWSSPKLEGEFNDFKEFKTALKKVFQSTGDTGFAAQDLPAASTGWMGLNTNRSELGRALDMRQNSRGEHWFSICGHDRNNKVYPALSEFHQDNAEAIAWFFRPGGPMARVKWASVIRTKATG
ncbi:hypothetical protein HDZ31DRAFT_74785 [Schizophyllum fasciatum]